MTKNKGETPSPQRGLMASLQTACSPMDSAVRRPPGTDTVHTLSKSGQYRLQSGFLFHDCVN
jgi:hypothetical protein